VIKITHKNKLYLSFRKTDKNRLFVNFYGIEQRYGCGLNFLDVVAVTNTLWVRYAG